MAVLLSNAPEELAHETLPHKTWTRREIRLVEGTGVFDGAHFELIEGELIDKSGKKRPHAKSTRKTVMALELVFGPEKVEQVAPIDVSSEDNPHSEPEPDVIVLRRSGLSIDANPQPSEIVLVVEVADAGLRQDLTAKARLYARAGIPEYRVLDINNRKLHVLRAPREGAYHERFELLESESVSPVERPAASIAVATLLG